MYNLLSFSTEIIELDLKSTPVMNESHMQNYEMTYAKTIPNSIVVLSFNI